MQDTTSLGMLCLFFQVTAVSLMRGKILISVAHSIQFSADLSAILLYHAQETLVKVA